MSNPRPSPEAGGTERARGSLPARLALVVCGAALATGCASDVRTTEVTVQGTVREVLRDGNTQARADLAELRGDATLVAVGALAGLEGEYTIERGQLWTSRPSGDDVVTARGPEADGQAAMVLSARVTEWIEVPVQRDVDPSELAEYVRAAAAEHGLDPQGPFPFLVDGTLADLQAHVIAGDCPMRARMLGRAPDPPPFEVSEGRVAGRIVGFYAETHEGEMTHHGSRIHAHVVLDGERPLTAHVESVGLARGSVLRLPGR